MQENPAITSWFFQEHAPIFLREVISPVFKVKDFSVPFRMAVEAARIFYGLLYIDDAPNSDSIDQMSYEQKHKRNLCLIRQNMFGNAATSFESTSGSLGTVTHIVSENGKMPPALPLTILVKFDTYSGPTFLDGRFSILPTTAQWKDRLSVQEDNFLCQSLMQ